VERMIVQVNDQWRIASDSHCFMVQKARKKNDSHEWRSISFQSSLEAACGYFFELQLRDDPAEIKGIRTALKYARDKRDKFLQQMMGSKNIH
jgi:hypothetical protein